MFRLRKRSERGRSSLPWLDSRHSFSFGDYLDDEFMGFRALRVLNEDRIAPGQGFGSHPHRDMEILTVLLSGSLRHQDSQGHHGLLRPGRVQWMRAGRGIVHSEMNASQHEPVHLIQVWIQPAQTGLAPEYRDRDFDFVPGRATWIASGEGRDRALPLAQDAHVAYLHLRASDDFEMTLDAGRHQWVQVLRGGVRVGSVSAEAGDGIAVTDEVVLRFSCQSVSHALVFDLA